ncbi:multiple organellar RNA editing factor 2, chloroplastic-like protein [Tanacetum coccineum]
MAATQTLRSLLTFRSTTLTLSRRLFTTRVMPPSFTRPVRSTVSISHSIRVTSPVRLNQIRCRVNRSGGAYSPLNSGSNYSERPPTEMAPLFPGCDYEHWLIVMDQPGGEGATKQQMIDCYVKTLATVLGR